MVVFIKKAGIQCTNGRQMSEENGMANTALIHAVSGTRNSSLPTMPDEQRTSYHETTVAHDDHVLTTQP